MAGQDEGCPNAAHDASHWVENVLLVLLAILCTYFTTAQTSPPLKVFNGRFIPDSPFPSLFALGFF